MCVGCRSWPRAPSSPPACSLPRTRSRVQPEPAPDFDDEEEIPETQEEGGAVSYISGQGIAVSLVAEVQVCLTPVSISVPSLSAFSDDISGGAAWPGTGSRSSTPSILGLGPRPVSGNPALDFCEDDEIPETEDEEEIPETQEEGGGAGVTLWAGRGARG